MDEQNLSPEQRKALAFMTEALSHVSPIERCRLLAQLLLTQAAMAPPHKDAWDFVRACARVIALTGRIEGMAASFVATPPALRDAAGDAFFEVVFDLSIAERAMKSIAANVLKSTTTPQG